MLLKVFLLVFIQKCLLLKSPILSPDSNDALINSPLELTCYAPKNVSVTKWGTLDQSNSFSLLTFYKEGTCTTDGFLADVQYFETQCYSNATFKVKIKSVNISNHGQEWFCSHNFEKSNKAYITVRVPASIVDIHISTNDAIRENETLIATCNTTACRPNPAVKWFIRSPKDTFKYEVTKHSTQSYIPQENGFTSAESKLELLPNRTINKWNLFCEVWTRMNGTDISSKEVVLNVLYPPRNPPKINDFPNGTTIRIVESESDELICSITGSNPLSTLSLTCFNRNSTALTFSRTSTSSFITWKAMRNFHKCTCKSNHVIGGKQVTFVKIEFMFPPSNVDFTVLGRELRGSTFVANTEENVSFVCSTESNPKSKYTIRNERNDEVALHKNATIVSHTIQNVSCDDAGVYTCTAENSLTIRQQAISKLNLIVKCQPSPFPDNLLDNYIKAQLYDDVILEFVAHDYFDEIKKTVFSWYKQNSSLQNDGVKYIISTYELQSNLVIRDVQKSDFGQYRMVASNTVGQYIHCYELQEIDEQEYSKSKIPEIYTYVAIASGAFISTVLVVALVVLSFRYNSYRKKKFEPNGNQKTEYIPGNRGLSEDRYDDNYATNDDRRHVYEEPNEMNTCYIEMRGVNKEELHSDYVNTNV